MKYACDSESAPCTKIMINGTESNKNMWLAPLLDMPSFEFEL